MIGQAMLLGAGFGLGVAMVWYGLFPPRPALAQVLDLLRRPPSPPLTSRQRRYRLLGAPLARLGLPSQGTRHDLALLDRDVNTFLAEQAAATGLGVLAAPILAGLWGAGGIVPLWLAILGGLVGYRWTLARVRAPAQRRRAQLRHTLSVVQDLVAVAMAGGAGVDEALDDATSVCTGWATDLLRHTLHTARLTREPVWQALTALGEDTGVTELTELANAIKLAGNEGARIRTSLTAHAAAMRSRATAEMETSARAAGVRMSLPVLVLALAYGLWLLYPALTPMSTGLMTQ